MHLHPIAGKHRPHVQHRLRRHPSHQEAEEQGFQQGAGLVEAFRGKFGPAQRAAVMGCIWALQSGLAALPPAEGSSPADDDPTSPTPFFSPPLSDVDLGGFAGRTAGGRPARSSRHAPYE